jgi:AcrR family transcriptional regulator
MARIRGTTAEQTRQRIIDAALELFTERAFAGTTLRDIAERLSLTKSSMYYHFSSKDALLDAILAPLTQSLDELSAATVAARAQLTPGDQAASDAFKIATVRRFVEVQLTNIPLMRSLLFDPSAMRAMRDRHKSVGFADEFERAFSGSDDEAVRMQHRCAMGAINGALLLTANAQLRSNPQTPHSELIVRAQTHAEVLVRSALAILGIAEK